LRKEYIHTGKCIWCKREKSLTSFYTAPHIVPKSLGGSEIGVDVCDDCNNFFGKCTQENKTISHDLAFKEVFNACLNSLGERPKTKQTYSSALFYYNRVEDKIKLRRSFSLIHFTQQFKRSLFEIFLQKYHTTYPDENLERFEAVRKYARYGIGDLVVLYAFNKMVFHFDNKEHDIRLDMSRRQKDFINETGFYHFFFCGKHLFLQVLPLTSEAAWPNNVKIMYDKAVIPLDDDCKLDVLNNILDFDMFYSVLSPKLLNLNGKMLY